MNRNINSMIKLNNGVEIPQLGLGVYLAAQGQECSHAIKHAVNAGYRHIDTAMFYQNEKDVGSSMARIGTYDSRAVAVAFVGSEVYRTTAGKKLADKMAEHDKAKAMTKTLDTVCFGIESRH